MRALALVFLTFCMGFSSAAAKAPRKARALRTIELSAANTAYTSEVINAFTVEKDLAHIILKRAMLPQDQTLYVVIVSGGGNVKMAYKMASVLNSLQNVSLICQYCASAAGALFELTDLPRIVVSGTNMMMHEMYLGRFTARHITAAVLEDLKEQTEYFNAIFWTRMKMTKAEYEYRIAGKDWTVEQKEMLKRNLADELVKVKCTEEIKQILPNTCEE